VSSYAIFVVFRDIFMSAEAVAAQALPVLKAILPRESAILP